MHPLAVPALSGTRQDRIALQGTLLIGVSRQCRDLETANRLAVLLPIGLGILGKAKNPFSRIQNIPRQPGVSAVVPDNGAFGMLMPGTFRVIRVKKIKVLIVWGRAKQP